MIIATDRKSPQIFVVEASAGSGKTYSLAQRYLRLLINPHLKLQEIPLKTILAITFTNKAAIEMKERILEFLKDIALNQFKNDEEKKELLKYLDVDMEYAKSKAHLIMDEIIKNYNFFQVQTIDSFINAILSGCAFRLNLSAHFKIKDEYEEYLAYSLDKLIDRAAQDKEVRGLFDEYLKQYLYLENKASWFPKRDILSIISSLFDDSNVYGAPFKKYNLKDKNEIFLRRRKIIQLMQELRDNEPAGTNQAIFGGFKNKLEKYEASLDIEEISHIFIPENFPIRKGFAVPRKVKKIWEDIRSQIGILYETEALALFNCYIDIYDLVYEDFRQIASREDVVFLTELNRKARILFDEQAITVPELYYRLATRFNHYLIDEFQDTSSLQWKNLSPMVEEALSKGGSLFYVGDKKQAIFRFRGGDTSLFDNVKLQFSHFSNSHNYLKDNYRSLKELVEFNHAVFSQHNLKRFLRARQNYQKNKDSSVSFNDNDMEYILSNFSGVRQNSKIDSGSGYVKIERVSIDTKEESDEIIKTNLIRLIQELKNSYLGYKNIAILCRKNQEIEEVTSWLLEEGVPVESEKTLNIKQHPLIKEIVSFLKFLNSPIDNLSFASFILGDVFLKAANFKKEEINVFLFNLHLNKDKNDVLVYLYRCFRRQYPEVWDELLDKFFKNVGFMPLYELVISILGTFEIPERFPESQGFIMRFLELVKKQVNEENASLSSFLDYFAVAKNEDLYVNVAETDAVKIMTIHKSKGLGFPVVIIPFLEIDVAVSSTRVRKPYLVYPDEDYLKLLKLSKTYLSFSKVLEKIYRSEYRRSLLDELNSVYVAFTRAQLELYAFIPKKSANNFNLANFLIPDELLEKKEKIEHRIEEKKIPVKNVISPSKYKNWIPYLKEEFMDKSQIETRKKILEGEIIHRILSFIGNLSEEDKDTAISAAISKARLLFPQVLDFQKFEETIVKLLSAKSLQPFFYVKEARVYREKEVVNKNGQTKRIDRLIIQDSGVTIIDYKSLKIENEDYRKQMLDYIFLIKDLFPGKRIVGFLLYLDDLSLEEVHG
jgi:ATP-dependent exoDNAse (exonuclease V) beta subunit